MAQKIAIVDYGMGNINSVKRKLSKFNCIVKIAHNPDDILQADKIILPGVGHFGKAMEHIKQQHIEGALNDAVQVNKKPILGICLGMQLMATHSEEGNCNGFSWFDAEVVRFKINDTLRFKVPHTGWNSVFQKKESDLLKGISDLSEFYFVHAYHFVANNKNDILTETKYENTFVSSVAKENIFGVQFHPEKSHDVGMKIFENFIHL